MEQYNVAGNQGINVQEKKKVNVCGIFAIILSIIPIILFIYCHIIVSSNSSAGGAVGWLLVIYYWTFGIPIFVGSIVLGVIGLNKGNKILPIISLVINGLKVLVLFSVLFGVKIFRIF